MINTLFDFFKSKGQNLPSVADRKTTYGLGNDYSGKPEQNTALLNTLQNGGGQSATTPQTTQTTQPLNTAVNDALTKYLGSLSPTQAETDTQNNLTNLEGATNQGVAGLAGRGLGTPLSLVRGQQAKLQEQGQLQQQTLQQKLANLQKSRQSAIDVSKFALDRVDSEAKTASERAYDTEKAKLAAETKASEPYTLNQGQQRFDSKGQVIASVAPKPTATKAPSTKSSVTPQVLAGGEAKLNTSRGSDGYADPTVYQQAYTDWVNNGLGTSAQFLTKFPPKNYVNPENTWLPSYLRPTTKSTARTA